ncbi:capsule biosynthesis protein [Methylobacterium brachythecii]|uniref:Capsular polysaccharide transport system permease protein n=1 Tax=Methylobacterium brachythecii TaxID=1176177 RepID=A0A7W6F983_9HYPH|nr:capsule biosynthesis protein [Methylobacterium brachythecii]MBB3905225.1 capsular polysaccharide transport system permease protein [Methylobacterium brachythecii]GLS47032.1 capsule polysaccharide export protein [Methylobacterium brachythecii]
MTVEIRTPQGQALTTADRSNAVAESLRQMARASRFADRNKGIRSYHSHVKSDPLLPLLFVVFCLVPTLLGALYYGVIASDRFVTEARFAIRPAIGGSEKASSDEVGTGNGVPKQLIAQDTIITASYVNSRPMIEAIEKLMPLREMFSRDGIDWLSRFNPEKPIEKFVKYWGERVGTKIETGSGIVTLHVEAFDPHESLALAQAVMKESERKVNELSQKLRDDGLAESQRELVRAEERMTKVRFAMRDLRNREGVLDAAKTNETNLKVIGELRKVRIEQQVQLTMSLRDLAPETRRIQDMKAQIKNLDDNIERLERQQTSADPAQRQVLSAALSQFEAYENEQKDAEKYFTKVLSANERARIVAARQLEFFSPIVEPILAESSTEPRRTLMISLIAAGSLAAFALSVIFRKYAS